MSDESKTYFNVAFSSLGAVAAPCSIPLSMLTGCCWKDGTYSGCRVPSGWLRNERTNEVPRKAEKAIIISTVKCRRRGISEGVDESSGLTFVRITLS